MRAVSRAVLPRLRAQPGVSRARVACGADGRRLFPTGSGGELGVAVDDRVSSLASVSRLTNENARSRRGAQAAACALARSSSRSARRVLAPPAELDTSGSGVIRDSNRAT